MQARSTAALPHGPEWRYEVKWDGWRVLALKDGDRVRLLTRNDNDITSQFFNVASAIAKIDASAAVLDGELIAADANGKLSFQALTRRTGNAIFCAFDLLHLNGTDLRGVPLDKRRAELPRIVRGTAIQVPDELPGEPDIIAREARKLGLEGILAKRRDSVYVSGDSPLWLKFKLRQCQEFVIGGYVPPMKAVVVGCYDGKRLNFCSQVYAGLDRWSRAELTKLLHPLTVETCPFANLPTGRLQFDEGIRAEEMANYRWVRPQVVAQIEFQEWTPAGLLRHSRWAGLRDDKAPRDCGRG